MKHFTPAGAENGFDAAHNKSEKRAMNALRLFDATDRLAGGAALGAHHHHAWHWWTHMSAAARWRTW